MELTVIGNLIERFGEWGLAGLIILYFLFKDYKQGQASTAALIEVARSLASLTAVIETRNK